MTAKDPQDLVLLSRHANSFEAENAAAILQAEGIPAHAQTTAVSMLWHAAPALGYGYDLFVRRCDVERARAALHAASEQGGSIDWNLAEIQPDPEGDAEAETARAPRPPQWWDSRSVFGRFLLGSIVGMLALPLLAILFLPLWLLGGGANLPSFGYAPYLLAAFTGGVIAVLTRPKPAREDYADPDAPRA